MLCVYVGYICSEYMICIYVMYTCDVHVLYIHNLCIYVVYLISCQLCYALSFSLMLCHGSCVIWFLLCCVMFWYILWCYVVFCFVVIVCYVIMFCSVMSCNLILSSLTLCVYIHIHNDNYTVEKKNTAMNSRGAWAGWTKTFSRTFKKVPALSAGCLERGALEKCGATALGGAASPVTRRFPRGTLKPSSKNSPMFIQCRGLCTFSETTKWPT